MSLTRGGRIILIVLGSALALVLLAVAGVAYTFGAFRVNDAERGFGPIDTGLRAHGARQLCHAGDAGYGPDNIQPWYDAVYELAGTTGLRATVGSAADEAGFELSVVSTPASEPGATWPSTTYQGVRDGKVLAVTVTPRTAADAGCPVPRLHRSADTTVVEVSLAYPDHHGQPAQPEKTRTPVPRSPTSWADRTGGAFEQVTVTGSGPRMIPLPPGARAGIVAMHHPGAGEFAVTSSSPDGGPGSDRLVGTSGAYDGVAPFGLENGSAPPPAALVVAAEGEWSLTISPLSAAPVARFPLRGDGDSVFLRDGAPELRAVHHGDGLFAVRVFSGDGPVLNAVFEPDGEYDGIAPLNGGFALIVVTARGAWSIEP